MARCYDLSNFRWKNGTMLRFFIFSLKKWQDIKIFHIFAEKMARC
jgi:hypothetical protein